MPHITVNGCQLYYEVHGNGKETLLFSHGLLWNGDMFAQQVTHFENRFRCIIYDHRGQGRSEVTPSGYDMEQIYRDALSLADALEVDQFHFLGLSMGGFVGMRLAARHPDRIKSLVLLETSAEKEPNVFKYTLLNTLVKLFGIKVVSKKVMAIMFGQDFLTDPAKAALRKTWQDKLEANKPSIVKAVKGVIGREGVLHELEYIRCPVLILVGDQDVATVPEKAKKIQQHIPQATLVIIPGAGHTSTVEQPTLVNQHLAAFYAELPAS
jgi:pimeloyl-ACP methyl ester carboxylesterase